MGQERGPLSALLLVFMATVWAQTRPNYYPQLSSFLSQTACDYETMGMIGCSREGDPGWKASPGGFEAGWNHAPRCVCATLGVIRDDIQLVWLPACTDLRNELVLLVVFGLAHGTRYEHPCITLVRLPPFSSKQAWQHKHCLKSICIIIN
jgi:hypothetical protein